MYRAFIQDLHNAHRRMECVLTLLRLQIDSLRPQNEPAVYTFLSNAINYMHNFPRLNHHACEELILSRLIAHERGTRDLCAGLTKQHQTFKEQESQLLLLVRRAQANETGAITDIQKIGTAYCEMHADHIRREELDALPMAVDTLRVEEWQTIISQSRLVRDPFDMADRMKGFEALYDYLVAVPDAHTVN